MRQKELKELASDPASPAEDPWEAAYLRFESPQQEIDKFTKRLIGLRATEWPRDSEIVELFCGRGNGLHALSRLGFARIEGVDLSPRLLAQYSGSARCILGDCRELPFPDHSKDALIVQGGLHHLSHLPDDLEKVLAEMHRVLRPDGRLVIVEPWLTRFLAGVHVACEMPALRRLSRKLDAFATMIRFERETYDAWLRQPQLIRNLVHSRFVPVHDSRAWGKWNFVGRPV